MEKVCFLLVSHLPHLEAVIGGSYGLEVDARTYLEKFFYLRIELPTTARSRQDRVSRYVSHLWDVMGLTSSERDYGHAIQRGLVALAEVYGLSLRTLERVATYVALVNAATTERNLREPSLVIGLCVMKQREPDLFAKARSGTLDWQTEDFLRLDAWSDDGASRWFGEWWRYVTDGNLGSSETELTQAMRSRLFRYNADRDRILPIICAYIEDLRIVEA